MFIILNVYGYNTKYYIDNLFPIGKIIWYEFPFYSFVYLLPSYQLNELVTCI